MRKYVLLGLFSIVGILGIFGYQYISFNDGLVHVIFCNVGQGDGVLIKDSDGGYFLLDSGPDETILGCMERNMPFWKRDISIAFLSHPHADHFVGYLSVLSRYDVKVFVTEKLKNDTSAYKALMGRIEKKGIQLLSSKMGDVFLLKNGMRFEVVGPSEAFLGVTSPGGKIGETREFANLVIHLKYRKFSVLFSGDSQTDGMSEALGRIQGGGVDVLHIPHHGSKTGLSAGILRSLSPSVGVISVGRNKYGHPSREVLELLNVIGVRAFRTDQHGDVEIVSDGDKFWVKSRY